MGSSEPPFFCRYHTLKCVVSQITLGTLMEVQIPLTNYALEVVAVVVRNVFTFHGAHREV